MSLLREQAANFIGASNEAVVHVVTTDAVNFNAPFEAENAGQIGFTMSAGEYGEIALEGAGVSGAGPYLYLTINGTHYKIPLEAWVPPVSPA